MTETATFSAGDRVHVSWTSESANCRAGRADVTRVTATDDEGRVQLAGFEMIGWITPNEPGGYAIRPVQWHRYRFLANGDDWRPVLWPPAGPCWCSGYTGDGERAVVIAYLPEDTPVTHYWPEADEVESEPVDGIKFTSRFPRPDWWPE